MITALAIASITVGTLLALSLWHSVTKTNDEGFMSRGGATLAWDARDLPIKVKLACDSKWVVQYRHVRKVLCDRVGLELFDNGQSARADFDELDVGAILISSRRGYNDSPATSLEYRSDGTMLKAHVELPAAAQVPERVRSFVLAVELLHILGLDQARPSNSLLLDRYTDVQQWEIGERDADRLRAMYN